MKKKIYLSIPIITVALIIAVSFYRSREKYITATIVISDTILNVTAQAPEKDMDILTQDITNEINRIDNILNPYNTSSEIAKINAEKRFFDGRKQFHVQRARYGVDERWCSRIAEFLHHQDLWLDGLGSSGYLCHGLCGISDRHHLAFVRQHALFALHPGHC